MILKKYRYLFLAMMPLLSSCGQSSDKRLVGAWKAVDSQAEFMSDGNGECAFNSGAMSFKWALHGNTLQLTLYDNEGSPEVFQRDVVFEKGGKVMTLKGDISLCGANHWERDSPHN